ncbi:MAG: HD domain-containing protein [Spirochaetes bacterium]|nr:HD domain-containing protein [Spirochaetota bacterium]
MIHQFDPSLHNRFGFYYALLDSGLILHQDGNSLREYLSIPELPDSSDIRDAFPEIIGLEDDINKVLSGEEKEFILSGINRGNQSTICFNLHIINYSYKGYKSIAVVHDITGNLNSIRSIQQNRNEIILLHNKLLEKNTELDAANRELVESRDETRKLNLELEEKVRQRTSELKESYDLATRLFFQTVNSLTHALEIRDPYTVGHQHRVAELAAAIAGKMDLDEKTTEGILIAGQLHDIGKIYVPSEFLTKPGVLSDEEFSVIKTHPRMGFEIIKDIEFPWPVASIVLQHHEVIDGSGYPYGLTNDEIRIEAKILCVADVMEAMSTNRPYRISPGKLNAINELVKYRSVKYDREVVDACVELFESGEFNWENK